MAMKPPDSNGSSSALKDHASRFTEQGSSCSYGHTSAAGSRSFDGAVHRDLAQLRVALEQVRHRQAELADNMGQERRWRETLEKMVLDKHEDLKMDIRNLQHGQNGGLDEVRASLEKILDARFLVQDDTSSALRLDAAEHRNGIDELRGSLRELRQFSEDRLSSMDRIVHVERQVEELRTKMEESRQKIASANSEFEESTRRQHAEAWDAISEVRTCGDALSELRTDHNQLRIDVQALASAHEQAGEKQEQSLEAANKLIGEEISALTERLQCNSDMQNRQLEARCVEITAGLDESLAQLRASQEGSNSVCQQHANTHAAHTASIEELRRTQQAALSCVETLDNQVQNLRRSWHASADAQLKSQQDLRFRQPDLSDAMIVNTNHLDAGALAPSALSPMGPPAAIVVPVDAVIESHTKLPAAALEQKAVSAKVEALGAVAGTATHAMNLASAHGKTWLPSKQPVAAQVVDGPLFAGRSTMAPSARSGSLVGPTTNIIETSSAPLPFTSQTVLTSGRPPAPAAMQPMLAGGSSMQRSSSLGGLRPSHANGVHSNTARLRNGYAPLF